LERWGKCPRRGRGKGETEKKEPQRKGGENASTVRELPKVRHWWGVPPPKEGEGMTARRGKKERELFSKKKENCTGHQGAMNGCGPRRVTQGGQLGRQRSSDQREPDENDRGKFLLNNGQNKG